AMDMGWGLDHSLLQRSTAAGWNDAPSGGSPQAARLAAIRQGVCQCRNHMKMELGMVALSLAETEQAQPAKAKDAKDKDAKDKDAKEKEAAKPKDKEKDKFLDELINQAIKEVVMHEVGHTLGLRHNFKGSTMLSNDKLHDT